MYPKLRDYLSDTSRTGEKNFRIYNEQYSTTSQDEGDDSDLLGLHLAVLARPIQGWNEKNVSAVVLAHCGVCVVVVICLVRSRRRKRRGSGHCKRNYETINNPWNSRTLTKSLNCRRSFALKQIQKGFLTDIHCQNLNRTD